MQTVFSLRIGWALSLYAFLDLVCAGIGMGVPIFCILFGFPVGWYIARRVTLRPPDARGMLRSILVGAGVTSAFTFAGMGLLWGRCIVMLFDPNADLANFGIPQILYKPVASFIGWLVLMILISPFLQLLMTLFGAHLTLLWWLSKSGAASEEKVDPPLGG